MRTLSDCERNSLYNPACLPQTPTIKHTQTHTHTPPHRLFSDSFVKVSLDHGSAPLANPQGPGPSSHLCEEDNLQNTHLWLGSQSESSSHGACCLPESSTRIHCRAHHLIATVQSTPFCHPLLRAVTSLPSQSSGCPRPASSTSLSASPSTGPWIPCLIPLSTLCPHLDNIFPTARCPHPSACPIPTSQSTHCSPAQQRILKPPTVGLALARVRVTLEPGRHGPALTDLKD